MAVLSRGFRRARDRPDGRLPPGQYDVGDGFPVLSAGPTPHTSLTHWDLSMHDATGRLTRWTWEEFRALPHEPITVDIHCVITWSKFDTRWKGSRSTRCWRTSRPTPRSSWPAVTAATPRTCRWRTSSTAARGSSTTYGGEPLAPEHGGPARLLVPHLYFWKSAKWLRRLTLLDHDEPGFWETFGYHNYGDPWREQRYSDD